MSEKYVKSEVIGNKWGISSRMVRNYCQDGKIPGSYKIGKTWYIPSDAVKPSKDIKIKDDILSRLIFEKERNIKNGLYHELQIEMAYNSNHMEGSSLSHEQTRFIFEKHFIIPEKIAIPINDMIETINHFECFKYVIDHAKAKLNEKIIKDLHRLLKTGTIKDDLANLNPGEYKEFENVVGGKETTRPEDVANKIKELLNEYNNKKDISIRDILDFHVKFESIHPFQDGNGRVGRLVMFKECLKHKIVPFIIIDNDKGFYYRGIKEWPYQEGYLMDTCLMMQGAMKEKLDYFRVSY